MLNQLKTIRLYLSTALILININLDAQTTYYVDSENGNDSNLGTSKSSAWKHTPFMQGANDNPANVVLNSGDKIVLRGGCVWDTTALPISIVDFEFTESKLSFESDTTWFVGDSWEKPVFDCQGKMMAYVIRIRYSEHISLRDIEIKNQQVDGLTWSMPSVSLYASSFITIKNFHIHDWIIYGDREQKSGGILIHNSDSCYIGDNVIRGSDVGNYGIGIYVKEAPGSIINNNNVSNVTNGIQGSSTNITICNNEVHHVNQSFDDALHENALYMVNGSGKVYNNVLHSNTCTMVLYFSGGNWLIFNNIIYNTDTQPFALEGKSNNNDVYHIFNNYIGNTGSNTALRIVPRDYGVQEVIVKNNIFINNTSNGYIRFQDDVETIDIDYNYYNTTNTINYIQLTSENSDYLDQVDQNSLFSNESISRYPANSKTDIQVDNGVDVSEYISFDLYDKARPFGPYSENEARGDGSGWDLGVYEYIDFTNKVTLPKENDKANISVQYYPNPSSGKTTIEYTLKETSDVSIELYNNMGQKVKTIANKTQSPGIQKITWDTSDLPNGVYFYQVNVAGNMQVKKIILLDKE